MRKPPPNKGVKNRWASAAEWVRRRRKSVKSALDNSKGEPDSGVSKLASRLWTKDHEKEKAFNSNKEKGRRNWYFIVKPVFLAKNEFSLIKFLHVFSLYP